MFKDKVVLITGAGSGIGQVTALRYAEEGATVVVADLNKEGGQQSLEMINTIGGKAIFIAVDVADYKSVQNLIKETIAQLGSIDIAINNAGIGGKQLKKTAEHSLEDWDRVIAVNQTGVFYCMKLELEQMMKQGSGNIVNIASIAGLRGLPNNLSYVASKFAVVGMTKTAAVEYARYNIRINAVCPVFTPTGLFKPEYFGDLADKFKQAIPMKRFGKKEEMAETILWLTSNKASFITGHAMPVDGGLTA